MRLMDDKIDLWQLFCRMRQMISKTFRTKNIEGDFAEELMNDFYGGTLATPSTKGYDFITNDGKKYQVKSRVATSPKNRVIGNFSDIRSWDFDFLIVVLFGKNGDIQLAKEIDRDTAKSLANTERGVISASSIRKPDIGKDITQEVKSKYNL